MDKEGPEKDPDTSGWPQWILDLLDYLEQRAASLEGTEPRPRHVVRAEVDRTTRELSRRDRDELSGRAASPPGPPAPAAALPARRKGRRS
jgi:hypothetical protein